MLVATYSRTYDSRRHWYVCHQSGSQHEAEVVVMSPLSPPISAPRHRLFGTSAVEQAKGHSITVLLQVDLADFIITFIVASHRLFAR